MIEHARTQAVFLQRRGTIEAVVVSPQQYERMLAALEEVEDAARIQGAIELLSVDPRPPSSRKLSGRDGYRVRVGNYRILYTVQDDVLLVVVAALRADKRLTTQALEPLEHVT